MADDDWVPLVRTKRNPFNRLTPRLGLTILSLAVSLIFTVLIFSHIGSLNRHVFLFIKPGSLLLLLGLFFTLKYGWRSYRQSAYMRHNMGIGTRYFLVLCLLVLAVFSFMNQDVVVEKADALIDGLTVANFNPVALDSPAESVNITVSDETGT